MFTSSSLNQLATNFQEDLFESSVESYITLMKSEALTMKLKYKEYAHMDWRDILNDRNMYAFQDFDVTVPTEVRFAEIEERVRQFAEDMVSAKINDYEVDSDLAYEISLDYLV